MKVKMITLTLNRSDHDKLHYPDVDETVYVNPMYVNSITPDTIGEGCCVNTCGQGVLVQESADEVLGLLSK